MAEELQQHIEIRIVFFFGPGLGECHPVYFAPFSFKAFHFFDLCVFVNKFKTLEAVEEE